MYGKNGEQQPQAMVGGYRLLLIQAVPFGVASNIQPQFISYVVEGEGFSLASFSLIFTIGTLVSAIASPGIGYIYNRVNPKLMYLVGSILACGGFWLFHLPIVVAVLSDRRHFSSGRGGHFVHWRADLDQRLVW